MRNLRDIKTTILGIVINGFVCAWLFTNFRILHEIPFEGYVFPVILLAIGVGFLFAPDRIIDALISFFNKR